MKNEKMFTRLLMLLFVVCLSASSYAQEVTKKEKKVIYKKISKKDGNKMKWIEKDGAKDVVWHIKGDGFEWDTTFNVVGDDDIDIHMFLKKRFPELDSMKNKRIEIRMDGAKRKLKLYGNHHHDKMLELKSDVFVDADGEVITLHIEKMDSLLSNHKVLQNFVFTSDDATELKVLHEELDGLKYEILTSIDEEDDIHTINLEVINELKDNMENIAYVISDGDKFDIKKISSLHSEKLCFEFELDDELDQEDLDLLKKSGIKIGSEKLDVSRLLFYASNDNFLNLKFKLKTKGKATIKIINEDGKAVFTDKVQYFPGTYDKETKLNMDNKGVFYISIEQNGKANAYKIQFNQ